jgi:hypothetical protein
MTPFKTEPKDAPENLSGMYKELTKDLFTKEKRGRKSTFSTDLQVTD